MNNRFSNSDSKPMNNQFITNLASKTKHYSCVKKMSLFVCVVLVAVFFLSSAYIFANANHVHNHGGIDGSCTTCVNLVSAQSAIQKQLGTAANVAIFALVVFTFLCLSVNFLSEISTFSTPISLKVRLNN
jgi:hypothetical protein